MAAARTPRNADSVAARALVSSLDPEQRQVAEAPDGTLVVLAGAGTGKTRAITHRIAYGITTGVFEARHVLALTFTSKAAGEMRSRLRSLGVPQVQARTFHSAALRQLRFFWSEFAEGPFPEILTHKAGLVSLALQEVGFEAEREVVRDAAAEIEYAAVSLVGIEEYVAAAASRQLPEGLDAEAMRRVMTAYSELKTRKRVLDFEDVLLVLLGVLSTREDIAANVRAQYRHFVVDEFQDVSPLQYRVLRAWLGSRTSLCVVGDPAQTIYTFAGARDSYLLTVAQEFPEATSVSLVRNYRSTDQIVEVANNVLSHTGRTRLTLKPNGRKGPTPRLTEYPDDVAEAEAVAGAISAEIRAGRSPSDIAVLFRTNGQSPAFEKALGDRGISYVLRGGERFFARREVKEAIALLRAAKTTRESTDLGESVGEVLGSIGWSAQAPNAAGSVRQRWESLNALVDLARGMQEGRDLPVPFETFLADLADRQEHQFAPTVNGVTLASVHAAKGLEWESVHLVGLTEGLFPITYATTPTAVAEERRLFYVAITRARAELSLSWSTARQASRSRSRAASRFVAEIRMPVAHAAGRTGASPAPAAPAGGTTARCTRCGTVLVGVVEKRLGRCSSCPADIDEGLRDALVRWRTDRAAAEGVPAYMVLTDATIAAIAELAPRTESELGRVPGIGAVKMQKYGEGILGVVTHHPQR